MFNPRFLHLMHQQVMFAFDILYCKAENFDANASKLNPLISGLGFEILSVPRGMETACLPPCLPRVDNKELTDQMLGLNEKTLPEKVQLLRVSCGHRP